MKKQKSIRETLPEEELKKVEKTISLTKDPTTKMLIEQMLSMTYDELKSIKNEIDYKYKEKGILETLDGI